GADFTSRESHERELSIGVQLPLAATDDLGGDPLDVLNGSAGRAVVDVRSPGAAPPHAGADDTRIEVFFSMTLLVSEAIVLHTFDYLESSRIVRLVTRDGGMRSGLARGARKSRRRFGSGLDLFAQGTAFLHSRPERELDTLSGFEDVRMRSPLAEDLERFHGAETIAEIALRFGVSG